MQWWRSQHPKPVVMRPEGAQADPAILQTLFVSLLNEIVGAEDQGNSVRLANKIARVRAESLLSKVNVLF